MKNLFYIVLLLPVLAFGQVTTGKPDCGSYSIDTGATHYPDHLWVICEGSGTTLADEGSNGTDYDFTFQATTGSGPDWDTGEATHGTVIDFVASNEDWANNDSWTASGTVVACGVISNSALNDEMVFINFPDKDVNNHHFWVWQASDGDLATQARDSGGTDSNNSNFQTDNGNWNMVCGRFIDGSSHDLSYNGGVWDTSATTKNIWSAVDRICLGSECDQFVAAAGFLDGSVAAIWVYRSTKSDAEISAIYNSGDPWSVIGVTTASADTWLRRRR